jgi:hypothetical protein
LRRGTNSSAVADNVGFGLTAEEVARQERTLDVATKEQQLRGAFLEPADAFFVPSVVIDEAFRDMPDEIQPQYDHKYVISWDPSATTDPTVVIVIDITSKPWRGVYFRRYEKPLGETKLLTEIFALHAYYNGGALRPSRHMRKPRAITAIDKTSMGGALLAQSLTQLQPKRLIELAGPNAKRIGLTNLRAALSTGTLRLPKSWTRVRREVLTYKLPDDKIVQDCVMTLLGNVDAATGGWGGETSSKFNTHSRVGRVSR